MAVRLILRVHTNVLLEDPDRTGVRARQGEHENRSKQNKENRDNKRNEEVRQK
jgi:hypothetical protein